jgi:hypothetical protein
LNCNLKVKMKFISLIYLIVVTLKCSLAFPFFMASVGSVPKRIVKYHTSRSVPAMTQYRRMQSLFESPKRFENVMFPDEQYIEQRKMTDSQSDESSDLHPIYVLPPPNFQPIVYPNSRVDGVLPGAKVTGNKELTLKLLPPRTFPYQYPHGFSSWLFGGMSALQRGSFWEQLSSDLALHNPVKAHEPNRVVVYVKRTQPIGQPNWTQFPTIEAHSVLENEATNHNNNNNNKVIKSKLPVGLTSFFLGGMRGISGRHWQMPPTLVSQVEFMPNDGKQMTDKDKKKTEYKPAVHFDDESDLYNVIKLD